MKLPKFVTGVILIDRTTKTCILYMHTIIFIRTYELHIHTSHVPGYGVLCHLEFLYCPCTNKMPWSLSNFFPFFPHNKFLRRVILLFASCMQDCLLREFIFTFFFLASWFDLSETKGSILEVSSTITALAWHSLCIWANSQFADFLTPPQEVCSKWKQKRY